jgi:hypothetical protein
MTMNTPSISLHAVLTLVSAMSLTAWLSTAQADDESAAVQIAGDYRYTYHDPETATRAQQVACREALRLAVSMAPPVREYTGSVVDPVLFRELVHTLSSQHVTGYRTVEQSQKGKTVYCKVQAALQPEAVHQVLAAQAAAASESNNLRPQTGGGLDRNRVLQLLAVEEQEGMIVVTYQALRRLDWSTTAYAGSLQGLADVMVEFYDTNGVLIRTYRYPARRTFSGDDVMQPGQVGVLKVPQPLQAKTYRVWLVK